MKVRFDLMLVAVLAACDDPVQPPGPKPTRLGVSIPEGDAENLRLGDTALEPDGQVDGTDSSAHDGQASVDTGGRSNAEIHDGTD